MPLIIAPSTLGLTQKSPHMATLFFSSHKHFSSLAMLVAGNALPLQTDESEEPKRIRLHCELERWIQIILVSF